MIWPFGNSEERKQKKRAKQARAFYEDALDQLEAQQYDKALDLLEQAKEFGHSEAEAKIAEVRAMFEKVEEQPAEQPQSTLKIPEEEANALYEKGIAARDRGDYSTALQALGDAAKGGMPAAIFEFGQLFFAGKGVERSLQRSFDCAMAAAKLGYPRAMLFIGTLYVKGLGFEPNGEKAVEWLGKAADLGDASAQFNLALLYSKGDLVDRNFDKAIPLAKAAAAQGHEKAQQLLDNLQESERDEWMRQGVESYKKGDFQNAAFLFRQSAGAGSAPAAFNLGLCYEMVRACVRITPRRCVGTPRRQSSDMSARSARQVFCARTAARASLNPVPRKHSPGISSRQSRATPVHSSCWHRLTAAASAVSRTRLQPYTGTPVRLSRITRRHSMIWVCGIWSALAT